MRYIIVIIITFICLQGCALLPSMSAGAKLADKMAVNQIAFQEAIIKGAVSIDCAVGWSIGARTGMTTNAKMDLTRTSLLAVVDQESKEYKLCYKFGLYGAYTMHESEWTVQRLLEFLGTIN